MLVVDQLNALSQSLWQEPSHDRLIKRYLELLDKSLGVGPATYLSLTNNEGRIALAPTELEYKSAKAPLKPTLVHSLESHLNIAKTASLEYTEGVNALTIGDKILEFALIGDAAGESGLVVWQRKKPDQTATPESNQMVDFITRQVQNSLRWLTRLDKTQALIYKDDLTGLYNYRYLDVALDAEIRRVGRFSSSFCLLFIDLDDFKPVNDVHGHLAGSQVLKQVGDVLREGLREVDSVFRYGGDEYVVLLVEATSQVGMVAGERIRRRIETTDFRIEGGKVVKLTASIGVACAPEHGVDKEALIRTADQHMYRAKHGGKNRVSVAMRDNGDDRKSVDPMSMRKIN